jgi:hypothetical protein
VRRRGRGVVLVVVAVLFGGAVASAAHAAPPALQYACSPAPANCAGWYRSEVKLSWEWDDITASPRSGDCTERTFTADTTGTKVFCEVADDATGDYTGRTVTVRVDRTPPSLTTLAFSRVPDRDQWFNSPVAFSFLGQDATSGIESCTTGAYGGPDGAGVSVTGSCRDNAGNASSGSFALNYDGTPPGAPALKALPGNHRVALSWSASPGAEAEVVRLGQPGGFKLLYRGPAAEYTDRKLRNGRRYRYVVTLIDQAGNRTADKESAVPTESALLKPASGAHVSRAPMLVWKPARRARYYNVQLVRRGTKILSTWPREPQLRLRGSWRFDGRLRRLVRGRYCWYVWPGFGARSERRYGRMLGRSCFIVTDRDGR